MVGGMRLASHLRRFGAASGDWWGGVPLQRKKEKRRAPNSLVSAARAPMMHAHTAVSMAPSRTTWIASHMHGRGMAGVTVPPMQTPPESKGKLTVKFGFPVLPPALLPLARRHATHSPSVTLLPLCCVGRGLGWCCFGSLCN